MYCTHNDIINEGLTEQLIVELCDDELEGSANERVKARETQAITKAGQEIDAELIEHYPVPLINPPAIINLIAAKLAVYFLYNRRKDGENPKSVVKEAEWARTKLREYKNRSSQLTAEDPKVGGNRLTSKSDGDRVFPADMFGKIP